MSDYIYTHNYEFSVGTDGDCYLKGEVEFDEDGFMSYKIAESAAPIKNGTLRRFVDLMELLHTLYEETGGIKLIKVKQKD